MVPVLVDAEERPQLRRPDARTHVVELESPDDLVRPPLPPKRLLQRRRVFQRLAEGRVPRAAPSGPARAAEPAHVAGEIHLVVRRNPRLLPVDVPARRRRDHCGLRQPQRMVDPVEQPRLLDQPPREDRGLLQLRDPIRAMRDRIAVVALTAQPGEGAWASAARSVLEFGPGRSVVVASLDRNRSRAVET